MSQPYEKSSLKLSKKQIITNNFIGGLSWALGATVGISVIFTVLTLISKSINLVPVVGSFVSDVIDFVLRVNPNLRK